LSLEDWFDNITRVSDSAAFLLYVSVSSLWYLVLTKVCTVFPESVLSSFHTQRPHKSIRTVNTYLDLLLVEEVNRKGDGRILDRVMPTSY
jgi:hypothetical protein